MVCCRDARAWPPFETMADERLDRGFQLGCEDRRRRQARAVLQDRPRGGVGPSPRPAGRSAPSQAAGPSRSSGQMRMRMGSSSTRASGPTPGCPRDSAASGRSDPTGATGRRCRCCCPSSTLPMPAPGAVGSARWRAPTRSGRGSRRRGLPDRSARPARLRGSARPPPDRGCPPAPPAGRRRAPSPRSRPRPAPGRRAGPGESR